MKQIYIYAIIIGIIVLGLLTLVLIPKTVPEDINYVVKYADYNDKIILNYELFVDGNVLDSSYDRNQPFSFVIGSGQVIKGFDLGVLGLTEGQDKTIQVSPENGYGLANDYPQKYSDDLNAVLISIKQQLGKDVNADEIQNGTFQAFGKNCKFSGYDLNLNKQYISCQHQLAGKTLLFKVHILKIEKQNESSIKDLNDLNDLNN